LASAEDLAAARRWVGSSPDDAALGVKIDAADSPEAAALAILETRRADFVAQAASLSISGHGSQSTITNIASLDADIARLRGIVSGNESGLAVFQMARSDRDRC
jgi:hypothetical protein